MRVRDILNIDDFNPLDVDITFLNDVSDQIPQEGYIDPAMAERLATVTLKAADKCVDLLAQSTLYVGHCDAQRRSAKSASIHKQIAASISATVAKEAYSDDEAYIVASNKYNVAFAWQTWIENKMDTLLKTHHLCKDLAKKDSYSTWQPDESQPQVATSRPSQRLEKNESNSKPTREAGKTSW